MTATARKTRQSQFKLRGNAWLMRLASTLCALLLADPSWAISVSIASPSNSIVAAPATITLSATATPASGRRVLRVDFFKGTTRIASDTSTPYTTVLPNLTAGTYVFTALAIDSGGSFAISDPVVVRVDNPPIVSLTNPVADAMFAPGTDITVSASANDSDEIVRKVEFFANGMLIGTQVRAPYQITWSTAPSGRYALTARATDLVGLVTTSTAIPIVVGSAPTVAIVSPATGTAFTAPATITVTATASDSDGTVTSVEFFDGGNLVGTATPSPGSSSYTATLNDVAAGLHSLTARAVDDQGFASVSSPVRVTVNAAPALYYIHTDHLNTPRMISNQAGTVVWRNDNAEPFGNSLPNGDPDEDGVTFALDLRFPGQLFDRETNLHHNYFRDYDPGIGRFVQSDPIGLVADPNTYLYVDGTPLSTVDSRGLIAWPVGVPFPRPVPPPPGPGGSQGGQSGGSGLPPELDPRPRPPTFPEIRVPPFPTSSPPPQRPRGCEGILETCLKGANVCAGTPLRMTIAALCIALYVACKAITTPWDPPPTIPSL